MALEAKLVQKLSQSLLMTPQLQQAIKLLQLGRLEYKEAIERELLENPILEEVKDDDAGVREGRAESDDAPLSRGDGNTGEEEHPANSEPKVDWESYLDSFHDPRGSSLPKGSIDWEERPSIEATLTKSETLYEHMLRQIRFSELQGDDLAIALQVIGNLDKHGYLCVTYEELAEECQCDIEDVERVVSTIQYLDPAGVASRDLAECLLVQLDIMGKSEALEGRIVRHHLDKLEKRRFDQIAKAEGVTIETVAQAVEVIQSLEPRPGRQFADEDIRYVVPDIYVHKVGNEFVIQMNEEGLPRLRISPYYLDLLKNADNEAPNKAYLADRLKAASWLIKSIHQRQQTIYKVTESIVKFQREFLEHGIHKLKPMVLKDVAEDIGMHESTVSRVTSNKYVHTPQGVFELKFFFTTAIKTASGEDVSSSSIKERIRAIIAAESPEAPVSDQAIVEILKREQVDIARRTVAKYRETLGIPSSSRRKRLF